LDVLYEKHVNRYRNLMLAVLIAYDSADDWSAISLNRLSGLAYAVEYISQPAGAVNSHYADCFAGGARPTEPLPNPRCSYRNGGCGTITLQFAQRTLGAAPLSTV
jgi:hypothetical protein